MTHQLHRRSTADSATGAHGDVKGYGSAAAWVTDDTGKVVASYERTRCYGGADVDAWTLSPTGARRPIHAKGEFRTIRARWEATVHDLYGVTP